MSIKIGVDFDGDGVFVAIGSDGGMTTTVSITADTARDMAMQLSASADTIDAIEDRAREGMNQ